MNVALVAADLSKWVAYGRCKVIQIFGFNNQAAGEDRYVQFFQTPTVANSDVPAVKALWCPSEAGFSWTFDGGLELSECLIGISTTEVNYTAPGANGGIDMTVVVETDFPVRLTSPATTVVGDLTSAVANLQVWADAVGGVKRLLRLDITSTDAIDVFAVVQPGDTVLTTDMQCLLLKIPSNTTKNFFFGKAGHRPYRIDGSTERDGCSVYIAAAPGTTPNGILTRPLSINAGTDYTIRAIYE